MDAPQSWDEVGPVVDALRSLDHLLDILWQPRAFMVERGAYSVLGKATPPKYAGRWQVIRYDTHNFHDGRLHHGRPYCVICTVTEPVIHNGVTCLQEQGAYMPVGPWLVEFMRAADAANVRAIAAVTARLAAAEARIARADDDDAGERDALDRVHFDAVYAGGVGNWQGQGMDFTSTTD